MQNTGRTAKKYTREEAQRLMETTGLPVSWELAEELGAVHEDPENYETDEETAARRKREAKLFGG